MCCLNDIEIDITIDMTMTIDTEVDDRSLF